MLKAQRTSLNQLTEKQREALVATCKLAYCDIPRRITSKQSAKSLNLTNSTGCAAEHLRKAELRLLVHLLEENNY